MVKVGVESLLNRNKSKSKKQFLKPSNCVFFVKSDYAWTQDLSRMISFVQISGVVVFGVWTSGVQYEYKSSNPALQNNFDWWGIDFQALIACEHSKAIINVKVWSNLRPIQTILSNLLQPLKTENWIIHPSLHWAPWAHEQSPQNSERRPFFETIRLHKGF